MKHIQLYESFQEKDVKFYLEKLSKMDTKKLVILLMPYKETLKKLFNKYSNDGVMDVKLITNDLGNINEGVDDVMKILKRLLLLPFNIIRYIVFMIGELGFTKSIIAAVFIFIIGLTVHDIADQAYNGIGVGVCKVIEFVPEHYETETVYFTDDDGNSDSYEVDVFVPDTWNATVSEPSTGRIEKWTTTEKELGKSSNEKDILRKENGWGWVGTIKYGVKPSGKFSGGGAGEEF